MMQVIFVFLVCLAASTVGGICGIGGGVVIKPLLDATGMMPISTLSFLSGLTVLSMAVIMMMTLATASVPDFDPLMLAAMVLAGVSGGFVSAKLQKKLTARQIDTFFSGLLVVILGICIYNALKFIRQEKPEMRTKCIPHLRFFSTNDKHYLRSALNIRKGKTKRLSDESCFHLFTSC